MKNAPVDEKRARERARVARTFAMGQGKFTLLRGVLGWGMPMFVIFAALPAIGAVPWFPDVARHPAVFLPLGAVIWFGGGYFFGRWMWKMVVRRHHELTAGN